MTDVDFTDTDLVGRGVFDGVGDRLGTVGAIDEDANALIVAPNPGRIEEGWTTVDEDEAVGFDANWFGLADETVAESDAPGDDVDPESAPSADEWPYTVTPDVVGEIDDDGVHLKI